MKRLVGLSALLLSLAGPALAEAGRTVTTTGIGVIDAVPDMAILDIGVTAEAPSAADALAQTSQAMQAVMARLSEQGVEARDMQTQGLGVQPLWLRPGQNGDVAPRITGYMARNGLTVRIRDLEALGEVLDLVVADGANTFNGLQFTLQDTAEEMKRARAAAVRDAMAKAEELAAAAGVTLGAVRSITEMGDAPRPVMMEMAATRMASDAVPVAPGEVSLSTRVTMVIELAE